MQKKNNGKTILTIIIILGIITAAIYFSVRSGIFNKPSINNSVRLEVDCDGGYAIITYTVGDESSNGTITVNTPWKKNFNLEDGASVFLTAGNPSQSGEITCLISLNGRDWKSDSVDYPKQAVACGGIIPHK
jgi:hypothetical protein